MVVIRISQQGGVDMGNGKVKKKPKYSVLQNLAYVLPRWWKWDKKGMLTGLCRIPLVVVIPLMGILLPKAVLDCVTEGGSLFRLAAVLSVFTFILCVCHMVDKYITRGQIFAIGLKNRMNYLYIWAEKIFTTDYSNIEQSKGQLQKEKAREFLRGSDSGGEAVISSFVGISGDILGLLVYTGIVASLHPLIIPFLLIIAALIFAAGQAVRRLEYRIRDESTALNQKLYYLFYTPTDFAAGKDFRLFRIGDWFGELFSVFLSEKSRLTGKNEFWWFAVNALQGILSFARDGICYFLLIKMVLEGRITAGDFTMYFGAVAGFSVWLNDIAHQTGNLSRFSMECCDYREFIEMPDMYVNDGKQTITVEEGSPVEICFEHVYFRYPDAQKDTLCDLNFIIKPGEKLALVGLNGAGKTTCIKLLCGLYHPTSGRILINGKDMAACSRDEYYRLFSVVFQEINFLPFSIAQNVSASETDFDRDEVQKCLEQAGLWDKVKDFPKGMDTMLNRTLNEDAEELSGGEWQKLLLARALYKKGPVIILDEPTAALDPIAENELYHKYGELTKGRTSLYISHRLASTRFCDRIFFLENGSVTEMGSHEELMARKGSYAYMYEIQSHYYKKKLERGEGYEKR